MESDCNACLVGNEDGESPAFYVRQTVRARKPHVCEECREPIPKGTTYEYVTGKWGGRFASFKTCLICAAIRDGLACQNGWMHGNLWDDVKENVFPVMSIACLRKPATAEARARLLAEWQKWKGL